MTSGREALRKEAIRNDRRRVYLEECEVVEVWTHTKKDDGYRNLSDCLVVQELPKAMDAAGRRVKPRRYDCVPLQRGVGMGSGKAYTPRVGDFVFVLLDENEKGIILGESYTVPQMIPVAKDTAYPDSQRCCADADQCCTKNPGGKEDTTRGIYDQIWKHCQWERIEQLPDETFKKYPVGKNPLCKKIFDDFRDEIIVWECKKGHESFCDKEECKNIGWITEECCSENQNTWWKVTSSLDVSRYRKRARDLDYKKMAKFHHCTGSRMCWLGYPEDKKGTVWLENMVDHVAKGHIHMRPCGSISVRSAPKRSTDRWGCSCDGSKGALLQLVSPSPCSALPEPYHSDPDGSWLINEALGHYVHVYGQEKKIKLYIDANTYILLEAGKITIKAANIELDGAVHNCGTVQNDGVVSNMDDVHNYENVQTDGTCNKEVV